jgi:hypothetical protein
MKAMHGGITKGLRYLQALQQPDGGFSSFSSPSRTFKQRYEYHTTFVPALMLNALSGVSEAAAIRSGLSAFLLKQRTPHWSFNYWARGAKERQTLPYPDDLDDTFCALIGLYRHDSSLVDADALAKIIKLLLATEATIGGPYRTWLVPKTGPKIWLDVDLAVNANIAYFLTLIGSPLPNLNAFIEQAVEADQYESSYYPSAYPVLYYLARTYDGAQKTQLVRAFLERRLAAGHWQTPLQTSLALSGLAHLASDTSPAAAVDFLLASQKPDGSWPAEAFCTDPGRDGKIHYHGAAALTTALAIEALHSLSPKAPANPPGQPPTDRRADNLYNQVVNQARAHFGALDIDLRTLSLDFLERLLGGDKQREIVMLPYFFLQSLRQPPALPDETLVHLCAANLYGWIAYTIYDDFLDDEGDPKLLSIANVSLRASLLGFQRAVPEHEDFQDLVLQTFDTIDAANTWEVTHCRFARSDASITIGRLPRYGRRARLADRSLGHTLTPLAVLVAAGQSPGSLAVRSVQASLRHYLIARQLSDDMHDWERDLRAGHITFVVKSILEDLSVPPRAQALEPLVTRMQQRFWNHTITDLCDTTMSHIRAARRSPSTLLQSPSVIDKLLGRIEASIEHTRAAQTEAKQFLESYRR